MDSSFGGVSFAPTGDNAQQAGRNAQNAGVPQAIQVISMALPRILGARPIAPGSLLTAPGSQGNAVDSTLWQTLLKTLGLPGGTAGPNPGTPPPGTLPIPGERGPEYPPNGGSGGDPSGGPGGVPGLPGGVDYKPRVIFQPDPTQGTGPRNPFPNPGRGGRPGY